MASLFHALVGCVAGGRILTATKTCAFCHGQFILAVALGVVQRHTSKKRSTHYMLLVYHVVNASTLQMMAAAGLGFLNA
jgi:hypothetical protein